MKKLEIPTIYQTDNGGIANYVEFQQWFKDITESVNKLIELSEIKEDKGK